MGYIINPDGCIHEASIKEGVLYVHHLDDIIHQVELPIPKRITCVRQRTAFTSFDNIVVGVLKNDDYVIVMRINGEIDLLTTDYRYVAGFKFEYIPEPCNFKIAGFLMTQIAEPCIMQVMITGHVSIFNYSNIVVNLNMKDTECMRLYEFICRRECMQYPMMTVKQYKGRYLNVNYDVAQVDLTECDILVGDSIESSSSL